MENMRAFPFWALLKTHRKRYLFGLLALLFVDIINVALPLVMREAIDAIAPRQIRVVIWGALSYLILTLVQSFGRYLWRIYLIGTSHFVASQLRLNLYSHLQRLPLAYYQRVRTGDLMSRATNDIESVRTMLGPGILVTVDAIFIFLFLIPVMFYLSPKLSLLALALYPFVPWLTTKIGNHIDQLFEQLQTRMSSLSAFAQESLSAVRLIKSLVLESQVHRRFVGLSEGYREVGVKLSIFEAAFSPSLGFITNGGTFLILCLGGWDVIQGAITVGTFIAFQRFVVQLSWPMEAIGWAVTMTREGLAANRRLEEILSVPSVKDVLAVRSAKQGDTHLEIRELNFSYLNGGRFNLSLGGLKLSSGARIGIVGPVGSGKSTLFQLLLRLYEPPQGAIFYRGEDVCSIPLGELRKSIASVEQQVFLFSEKITTNITLGIEGVSDQQIRSVTAVGCVDREIEELPSGYECPLGERGVNLSGGQKQRIALARSLVRNPELLLLDDCFSAVDVGVERDIIQKLFVNYPNLSLLFSSHRLSVMEKMDEIWLLEGGRVLCWGGHRRLLNTSHLYRTLWEKSEREKGVATLGESL